jgi:predicted Zn-dependent peptidase
MKFRSAALAGAAIVAFASPIVAQTAKPAPTAELVRAVDIPYQQFTLKNGLRVIVHTDRKAPVVAVSVWYDVGSKHEPQGKTGFAHLFEHLMFNGSENAPGDFFSPLKTIGATDLNGTTYYDRTNYFETVPTAALSRALFLESDRMGYLTGAITQSVLDEQRGVVQNETRQGDNQPYGLVDYRITEGLFPATHPYGHTTIGSMADLDKASLDDVKTWFKSHYGPNNAVLVLAGDIDVATAKPLVEKYFGAIPAGPKSVTPPAAVTSLAKAETATIKDRVAATLLTRSWVVPGLNDPAAPALDIAAGVLGGLASSRLEETLVRGEKLFTRISVGNQSFAQVGQFQIYGYVRPGVDAAQAAKRLDEVTADFLRTGPTADEVQRVVTTTVAGRIRGFESVGGFGGKAVALAEGALYSNDPGFYKKYLAALAAQTPATVKAAADKWLSRPVLAVNVVPGERDAYAEAVVPPKAEVTPAPEQPAKGTRGTMPAVGQMSDLSFPAVTRTRLANGMELIYAQRTATPFTRAVISFDAGRAADPADKLGTQQLTLDTMDEAAGALDASALAQAKERLGADIGTGAGGDRTVLSLGVPSANLAPALDLFADVARRPTFAEADVARVRNQQLAQIAQELTSPNGIASRIAPQYLFPAGSPYAKPGGSGDPKAVAALTRADLIAFRQAWLRPDKAKIFVVSDRPLAEVKAAFDQRFGDWKAEGAAGTKRFPPAKAVGGERIVLVDRPDSPQSLIIGAQQTNVVGTDDLLPLVTANDSLGGDFLSRINLDLRENRHWSYGAFGTFNRVEYAAPYRIQAPVQADKTGPAVASLRDDLTQYVTSKPMTQEEFDLAINGAIRSGSGEFETSDAVLAAMQQNDLFKRPDNYFATINQRYRAMTLPQLRQAITQVIRPGDVTWIVIGEAAKVKPQLDTLGLPVEVRTAASMSGAK